MTPTVAHSEQEQREQYALALAFATVRRFRLRGTVVNADDLLSAALHGAAIALDRYEPSRGPFGTFAITWIRGQMLNEARDGDCLTRSERHAVRAGGAVPRLLVSLDALLWRDEVRGHDVVPGVVDVEEAALAGVECSRWERLIGKLPAREGEAIRARFWEGHTHEEIARTMGVVPSRVDQLMKQGFRRLRMWGAAYGLAPEGWSAAEETPKTRRRKPAQQQAPERGCETKAVR